MPESNPLAGWLSSFLVSEQTDVPPHVARKPRRYRSLINERRWESVYPLKGALNRPATIAAIRGVKAASEMVHYTPWLFDPEVQVLLSTCALNFLVENLPLLPGDLVADDTPLRTGREAARVALLLYMISATHAPLDTIRRSPARLIAQILDALKREIGQATPSDLIAIHVMMRRLLTLRTRRWALEALQAALPFSPLTRLIEDSEALSALAPYQWTGIAVVLASPGLDGLQSRCVQALVDSLFPGWHWHEATPATINARFLRSSELFTELTSALATFDGSRAMHLATWIMRVYKMMGQALEVYQRVVLPPPLDARGPALTPSFRMLLKFLPTDRTEIQENFGGFVAPIEPVIGLLLEASRLTGTQIYVPDSLPQPSQAAPLPESDTLRAEAKRLVLVWKSMEATFAATLGNLYQFVQTSPVPPMGFEQIEEAAQSETPQPSTSPAASPLDEFQFDG